MACFSTLLSLDCSSAAYLYIILPPTGYTLYWEFFTHYIFYFLKLWKKQQQENTEGRVTSDELWRH